MTATRLAALYVPMDLEATVTELAPALVRYGSLVAGNTSEGEDIAQEALAALVRYWRRNGPPESPRVFALTVARRTARRTRWRRRLLDPLGAEDERPHSDPAPDDVVVWRQQLRRVRARLAELPARERQALILVAVSGLSIREAAQVLDASESAVKMRVHRARLHLKKKRTLRRKHGQGISAGAGKSAARVR